MLCRFILPKWKADVSSLPKVVEGEFSEEKVQELNRSGYNIYFLPNYPSQYDPNVTVDGLHIDVFKFVFCDMDLKEGKYANKEQFIAAIGDFPLQPSFVVDSGNGIHVYWEVSDLDPMSFLKLQRRLMRRFNTDEAVAKIYQLMRVPGTLNTKKEEEFKECYTLFSSDGVYSCEIMDRHLPPLTREDEEYCTGHFDKTYNPDACSIKVDEKIPLKFKHLLKNNKEVKEIWSGNTDDRSKGDYRLGHIMFGNGFTKEEALSVLVNTAKALSRSPTHRINYASGIVDKIWTFELENNELDLSSSVKDILSKGESSIKGQRFPCWKYIDATHHGFRLGQVIGLVAGSGVGKTAMALNMFMGFVQNNPDYVHFFIPLEQPANEIADRWRTMCGEQTHLHEKVHVMSNYSDDGSFRRLSLNDIKEYLLKFKTVTGKSIGCVVIDHIGALKKESKNGENQGIMDICHEMKAFAIQTDTLLVMQSQSSREKAGIGDIELNKDAAYGTVFFESYCDYLITIWQPLKRCYSEESDGARCPTVTAFKFCKIRHKKTGLDEINEDVPYRLMFNPDTGFMDSMNQSEEVLFDYWDTQAMNKRKKDRKTDIVSYQSIRWVDKEGEGNGKADNN